MIVKHLNSHYNKYNNYSKNNIIEAIRDKCYVTFCLWVNYIFGHPLHGLASKSTLWSIHIIKGFSRTPVSIVDKSVRSNL